MKHKITLFVVSSLAVIATTAAFAYGSSAGAVSAKAAKLGTGSSSLGRIVVDGSRRTLYLFERDKGRSSACYGGCAIYWPPLLTHGKPIALAGLRKSLVGTTRRNNGSLQVTYAGHPLYRYAGDARAGETTGAGLQDYGGGWDPLSPAGKKIEAGD
jgi:predicted lipoprotein with Yx(FWY)xxD motif